MTQPFQHSGAANARYKSSGYVAKHERKDCCARCVNMVVRGRNPYCNLHRIHVEKLGTCFNVTNPLEKVKPPEKLAEVMKSFKA